MEDRAFNNSVQAEISAANLRNLYSRLDAEEIPYDAVVRKSDRKTRLVVIHCAAENVEHFNILLDGYKG